MSLMQYKGFKNKYTTFKIVALSLKRPILNIIHIIME